MGIWVLTSLGDWINGAFSPGVVDASRDIFVRTKTVVELLMIKMNDLPKECFVSNDRFPELGGVSVFA